MDFFTEEGPFHSEVPFSQPISQLRNEGVGLRNGTRVPKVGFAGAFAAAKWGLGCENELLMALVISQRISQLQNGGMGCEMALVCQMWVSQL